MKTGMNDKKITWLLWVTFLGILLLFAILTSCGAVDRLETSHYHFYDDTEAIIVVKKDGKYLYCQSPAGIRFYRVFDHDGLYHEKDTILLHRTENYWVFENVKFIKEIPD